MRNSDVPRFIVRRFNWKATYDGDQLRQAPGEHRVAWFDTEAEALAECARRESDVRERVNPFRCGPAFHYLSTFPQYAFKDWLLDAGISLPDGDLTAWAKWWETLSDPAARGKVWEGLNRVRFHDVIARRPSEVAYAVVQVMWDYMDDFYTPGAEGGTAVKAYRTREKAESECWVLNEQQRAEMEREEYQQYALCYRHRWEDEGWLAPQRHGETYAASKCPMYEVVEVDLGGGANA